MAADRRLLWQKKFERNGVPDMSKKIVVLNGSPRKKGNTSMLVKAFTEGAESAGNIVTEFFLDSMEIHGCKGCFGGHSSKECPGINHMFGILVIRRTGASIDSYGFC